MVIIINYFMNFFSKIERILEVPNDPLPDKVDVVIGIGADVSKDGLRASPYSRAVALKAAELVKNGKAKYLLFTGGYSTGEITEAEAMAKEISGIVPSEKIFLETKSSRTYGNADYSLLLMNQHRWKTAIIVAQQWYARRARATFRKRWKGNGIQCFVVKAYSPYGGGSQRRFNNFLYFLLWDTASFIISKLKGYC